MKRGPLHTLPDEEPDLDESHKIPYEIWTYPGCRFCGREDHREKTCPSKPAKATS